MLSIVLLILAALGLAAWQIGEQTGAWRQLSVKNAAARWHNQPDSASVEAAIDASLQAMANDLEDGQIEQALAWIHPDQQEVYRSQLSEHPGKAADFSAALKSAKVIYISSDSGNYESGRMALIAVCLPSEMYDGNQTDQTFTLVLVWYEDRWVIDS